jgi:DNA repair protein RadA/Sms
VTLPHDDCDGPEPLSVSARRTPWVYECPLCQAVCDIWQGECPTCDRPVKWIRRSRTPKTGLENLQTPSTIGIGKVPRLRTGIEPWDRVLGGGYPRGTCYLLAGKRGSGKSTVVLQSLLRSPDARRPLYISAEETPRELRHRLYRLGVRDLDRPKFLFTKSAHEAYAAIEAYRPDLLGIDSAQTFFDPGVDGAPDGPAQTVAFVRRIYRMTKRMELTTVLVARINETHAVKGGVDVEYEVDGVIEILNRKDPYRLFRPRKNRYGAAKDVRFELHERGIFAAADDEAMEPEPVG